MEIGSYLWIFAALAITAVGYIFRDNLKKRAVQWLAVDSAKGDVSGELSESTTAALEEVRRMLQKKHPRFELVRVRYDAGEEKTLLDHGSMSKEELLKSGENGYGVYGRLIVFRITLKTNNDVSDVTARCRVESNKPGIWKAAFVEFNGAAVGQTGHPQKVEEMALPAHQASPAEKVPAVELDDVPSMEDVAKEGCGLPPTATSQMSAQSPASPTGKKASDRPRAPRRQRTAATLDAVSALSRE